MQKWAMTGDEQTGLHAPKGAELRKNAHETATYRRCCGNNCCFSATIKIVKRLENE
jgi:hypothetical protein